MWQNGSTAPPINIQQSAPRATFHVHVRKSVHSCNLTIPTKKSLERNRNPTGSRLFWIFSSYLWHFCHFQVSYFNELLPEIYRMNTKIGHCNLKPFVTLNCEDLEFSSEGVSVASSQISMFRHETGSCYTQACYVRSAPNFTCLIDSWWRDLMTIFSYSNSATCWQQEVTCFTL